MKLPCAPVRDLLPLYAEKMVEPETEELIKEHLADCPDCRQKLECIETGEGRPVETTKPLENLKKEIVKRRVMTAALAALIVFVAVFAFFSRESTMRLIPWEEDLVKVQGVEQRPRSELFADPAPAGEEDAMADVLVVLVDDRINGTHDEVIHDDDGSSIALLQCWSSNSYAPDKARGYVEHVYYPVPDRLLYDGGGESVLLWGEPMNGGVQSLPRLALAYYLIIAAMAAIPLGVGWLLLRKKKAGDVLRQLFFAPVAYIIAHFLIKGWRTSTFFLERDFASILLTATALYALMTLAWQLLRQRWRKA